MTNSLTNVNELLPHFVCFTCNSLGKKKTLNKNNKKSNKTKINYLETEFETFNKTLLEFKIEKLKATIWKHVPFVIICNNLNINHFPPF